MNVTLNRHVRVTVRVLFGTALGILPIKQLFTDSGWLVDSWLTMAIMILPAAALRIRLRPAAWHLLPGLVLATLFLTARFLPEHATFGFIPSFATGGDLSQVGATVRHAMSDEAAPLHTSPAIRFYLAAGLALLAALIDVVAVCLRAPALTGIAFLLAATICGAVARAAVSWWLVAAAVVGYLIVLSSGSGADLARWGRRAPDAHANSALRSRAGESGRRIGAISLVLALLVASLVPIPSGNILADMLHHNGGADNGKGTGTKVFLDPLASLRGQLTRTSPVNMFEVNVTNASGNQPFYLRQEVLETYNGTAWVQGSRNSLIPRAITTGDFPGVPAISPNKTAADTFTAKIHIQQAGGAPPLFYVPDSLADTGDGWRWDQGTQLVIGQISRNQTYTEQVVQPRPNASELKAADPTISNDVQRDLQLPDNVPSYVTNLVTELTASATTPYDRALAIFNYFADTSNNFGYSLNTKPGDSGSDLVDFLNNRVGYCQQYAAAMGVMLRSARVPARVVLGYTHSAPDKSGHFQVTTNDAHAWVEAYFAGLGWVPFDPTPLTGSDATRAVALPWAPRNTGSDSGGDVTSTSTTGASESASNGETSAAATASSGSGASGELSTWWPTVLIVLAALIGLGLVPALLRALRRRRRYAQARSGHPLALWSELEDTCIDLGIGWSSARSPRQVAAWLREFGLNEDGVTQLRIITDSVELHSYGPRSGVDEVMTDELGASVRIVRGQLIKAAERADRWRMRLWPVSLWRSAARTNVARRSGSRI